MTGFNGQVATKLRAWMAERPAQDFTAVEISKALGENPNTVGPLLSSLYYEGWLDRHRGPEGRFLYSNPARRQPTPREHPIRKRRSKDTHSKPAQRSAVRVKVCGVEMSIDEAFEVYEELSSLFESVTTPRSVPGKSA